MNRISQLITIAIILLLLISCTTAETKRIPNCITSKEIKSIIKSEFGYGFKYDLRDMIYYSPKIEDFKKDYEIAKKNIANDFGIPVDELRSIWSNLNNLGTTIWDCDNVVRELKSALDKIHYKRFLKKEHNIKYEYAAFGAYGWHYNYTDMEHVYLMVLTDEREIFFVDFPDYVWSIDEFKPKILGTYLP
jgi:hypothetical protein